MQTCNYVDIKKVEKMSKNTHEVSKNNWVPTVLTKRYIFVTVVHRKN